MVDSIFSFVLLHVRQTSSHFWTSGFKKMYEYDNLYLIPFDQKGSDHIFRGRHSINAVFYISRLKATIRQLATVLF